MSLPMSTFAGLLEPRPRPNMLTPNLLSTLDHYAIPGVAPPSARVVPKKLELKIKPRPPMTIWDAWKFGAVLVSKATEITGDVLSHHVFGPRKQSWGIGMTLISSFMRGAGRHTQLVDIATVRSLVNVVGMVPLPADALVTPVTFRVRNRNLRGFLADCDAAEDGSRELSGEWVVSKKTWQRLQAEWRNTRTDPSQKSHKEHVVLYIHGGAYSTFSAAAQRSISIPLAKSVDARVFALDYRLAPETRFPGPLHDVVTSYFRFMDELHIPPENILLSGDSAGGGLCLALLMYLRDNDYPMPSGCILISPWVDLTMSCDSWDSNTEFDVVPYPQDGEYHPTYMYLGDKMEEYMTHPYASPLFGDFKGLPPLLIQVGDAEVLRDEITLLAHKAALAGVDVKHELYQDAIHIFPAYPFLSASRRAYLSMTDFVKNILPCVALRSPQPLGLGVEFRLEQEILNENVTVLRGDGIGKTADLQAVNDKLEMEKVSEVRELCQDGRHSPLWSFRSLSSLDEDSEDDRSSLEEDGGASSGTETPPSSTGPETPPEVMEALQLHRMRSASICIPRNRSHDLLGSGYVRLRSKTMSHIKSPSLRRSATSHPDLW